MGPTLCDNRSGANVLWACHYDWLHRGYSQAGQERQESQGPRAGSNDKLASCQTLDRPRLGHCFHYIYPRNNIFNTSKLSLKKRKDKTVKLAMSRGVTSLKKATAKP